MSDTKAPKKDPFGWVGHAISDKYEVESVVGEGGFGVVYRAQHRGFEEPVAIKCLKVPTTMTAEEREHFLETFLSEGKLLHRISKVTADVVQALDVGVATSPTGVWTPYMVLEWLDGRPLSLDLRERATKGEGGRSIEEAISLLDPAARALAAAHEQGIAHRDVKPSNLFLTTIQGRSTVKVVDFGIAKVLSDSSEAAHALETTGGAITAFTPRYGAPEQFTRRYGATGPWTDVFAFALVLVEVVTGEPALEGDDPAQLYVASSDLMHRPTFRAKNYEVSDDLENIIHRATNVDPRKRYPTLGEFWDELCQAVPDAEVRTRTLRPPGVSGRTTSRPDTTDVFDTPSEPRPPTNAAHRSRATVIGLVAAAVGLTGAAVLVNRGGTGEDSEPVTTSSSAPSNVDAPDATVDAAPPAPPAGMAYVPPGKFFMGSDSGPERASPRHEVTLTKGYFMDVFEVSVNDYTSCVKAAKCTQSRVHTGHAYTDAIATNGCNRMNEARKNNPVNCVDQEQASAYCAWVQKRLPTEAEWEYAARGSDGRSFPWGEAPPETCWTAIVAHVKGRCSEQPGTWDVGSTTDGMSPFGLFDMAGNVWEWVADGWELYPKNPVIDPFVAPSGSKGILRGGSWDYSAESAKSTNRLKLTRQFGHISTGFRCAKSIP